MKKSSLQTLLDQVELIYQRERQIALHLSDLQLNLPENLQLNSILGDVAENKTHCERLEGLIEIITTNLQRKLSSSETDKYVTYCSELLHRFEYKHTSYRNKSTIKLAEPIAMQEIEALLNVPEPEELCQ